MKLLFFVFLLCCVSTLALLKGKHPFERFGIALLDSVTFPLIVPHHSNTVVVLVSHADTKGEYGPDSLREDYSTFAEKGTHDGQSENVLFAQIIVSQTQNLDLARRFGLGEFFSHPKLFLFKPGSAKHIPFPEKTAFDPSNLANFISSHSDFFIGLPGLIPRYDTITKSFITAHHTEYDALIAEAESYLPLLDDGKPAIKNNALYYIKFMKRIKESGFQATTEEFKRLKKILSSDNLSPKKKKDFESKMNIIQQFTRTFDEEL